MNDPWALALYAVIVLAIAGPVVWRLRDRHPVPLLVFPSLLGAIALPSFMVWQVLTPVPAVQTVSLAKRHEVVEVDLPAGSSLMITGVLDEDAKGSEAGKTDYLVSVQGDGWKQQCAHKVAQKTESSVKIELPEQQIGSGTTNRGSKWGEDKQFRCDLPGAGPAKAELVNWNGAAAKALDIEVIPSPFGPPVLYVLVGLLVATALVVEVKWDLEKYTGDIAFLAFYAVFVRNATPLDAFPGIASAALPSLFVGEFAFAGLAYVVTKGLTGRAGKDEAPPATPPSKAP